MLLLQLDVELEDSVCPVLVYENSNVREVSIAFCAEHELDDVDLVAEHIFGNLAEKRPSMELAHQLLVDKLLAQQQQPAGAPSA